MWLMLATHHWIPIWHQLSWLWGGEGQGGANGTGYLITSGPLGDLFIVGAAIALYKKWTCHDQRCWRPGLHHVEGTPYVTCGKHHPTVPNEGVTAEIIKEHHLQHKRRTQTTDVTTKSK